MWLQIKCKFCNEKFFITIPKSVIYESKNINYNPDEIYKKYPVICKLCKKEFEINLIKEYNSAVAIKQDMVQRMLKEMSQVMVDKCFFGGLFFRTIRAARESGSYYEMEFLLNDLNEEETKMKNCVESFKQMIEKIHSSCSKCNDIKLCTAISSIIANMFSSFPTVKLS